MASTNDTSNGVTRSSVGAKTSRADEIDDPHVRNVEQAGAFAGVKMLGLQPGRILDRHVGAGKAAHLRAEFAVQRIQRHLAQCVVHVGPRIVSGVATARPGRDAVTASLL